MLSAILALAGMSCSSNDNAAGSSNGTCADACAKGTALNCAHSTTQENCEAKCNTPPVFPGCDTEYGAYIGCFKKAASFACDSTGLAQPVGCEAQFSAAVECVARTQLGDAGTTGD